MWDIDQDESWFDLTHRRWRKLFKYTDYHNRGGPVLFCEHGKTVSRFLRSILQRFLELQGVTKGKFVVTSFISKHGRVTSLASTANRACIDLKFNPVHFNRATYFEQFNHLELILLVFIVFLISYLYFYLYSFYSLTWLDIILCKYIFI